MARIAPIAWEGSLPSPSHPVALAHSSLFPRLLGGPEGGLSPMNRVVCCCIFRGVFVPTHNTGGLSIADMMAPCRWLTQVLCTWPSFYF